MKGVKGVLVYSNLRNKKYNLEDVFRIPNHEQNAFYLEFDESYDHLVDIFSSNGKIIYCWEKCPYLKYVFDLWCKRKEKVDE